jgi:hypothetical protein
VYLQTELSLHSHKITFRSDIFTTVYQDLTRDPPPTPARSLCCLGVLPRSGLSSVGCNDIEAQASIIEMQTLESDKHLPRVFVTARSRAGDEPAILVGEVAERVAFGQVPPSLDIVLGDSGRVGNSVLDSARFTLDVHLLTTRNESTHTEGGGPAEEVGGIAGWAAGDLFYAGRAIRSGGFVEPDGVVRGCKVLVMDRGG